MIEKKVFSGERICPRCERGRLKSWRELAPDEKFIAERQPASADYSKDVRKTHLFCANCWFETGNVENIA